MKENHKTKAEEIFSDTNIKITTEGRKYLGGFIGNPHARSKYAKRFVEEWVAEIHTLSKIASTEPQAENVAFISGYQHKLTCDLPTFENLFEHLAPFDHVID